MDRPTKCWICSGSGNSLCVNCNRARLERMAKFNIDGEQAAWELRQMVIEEESDEVADLGFVNLSDSLASPKGRL